MNDEKKKSPVDSNICTGCGLCSDVCPVQAIKFQPDNILGHLRPQIDKEKCINCGLCERKCPSNDMVDKHEIIDTYAAWAKDDVKHYSSSSGGIASSIYEYVTGNQGLIVGVQMEGISSPQFECTASTEKIEDFKKSKYLQVEHSQIYKNVLEKLKAGKTVAFVGSRRASLNGKDSVRRIISDLKNTDICIVSGLATGIDTVSHQSAIENNLKTIGVIASGFDYIYPSANKYLYDKIENECGAVITEYYPTFEPTKFRFPQRNRIVSGLSYGTVVAEAAIKSGALITANLTLEQGRELMCIPGTINNINTEGIFKLLKDGATMVTCGQDILNALNWSEENIKPIFNEENLQLNQNEKIIFDIINIEPKGFDEIQAKTGLQTDELLICLTGMELRGLIVQSEGDKYKRA